MDSLDSPLDSSKADVDSRRSYIVHLVLENDVLVIVDSLVIAWVGTHSSWKVSHVYLLKYVPSVKMSFRARTPIGPSRGRVRTWPPGSRPTFVISSVICIFASSRSRVFPVLSAKFQKVCESTFSGMNQFFMCTCDPSCTYGPTCPMST